MTMPLIVLAAFSVFVAWGWPIWEPHSSYLGHLLEKSQPPVPDVTLYEGHAAGWIALALAVISVGMAVLIYGLQKIDPAVLRAKAGAAYGFLRDKWHFDEIYDAIFVRPAVALGFGTARFDKRSTPPEQAEIADRTMNVSSLDGVLNALGLGTWSIGVRLRIAQSGLIRSYVIVLVLAVVALLALFAAVYLAG